MYAFPTTQVRVAKAERAAAIAAAVPVIHPPPALARGEVRLLEVLYSTGTDVPPIRKQALDFGLGLDAAGQLEDANIRSSSNLTESSISIFQSKLKVRRVNDGVCSMRSASFEQAQGEMRLY